jgi:transketolase
MAAEGLKPILYGIAAFVIFRALEQIRIELVHDGAPVKLIGYGAGNFFKHLGPCHTTGREDLDVAQAIGLPTYETVGPWIELEGPAYLRIC